MTDEADESVNDTLAADELAMTEAEQAVEDDRVVNDIAKLQSERDSFKDVAQRLQADFDNYRKRVGTQLTDEIQRATGRIAEALLPVLDACEAAFLQHPAEVEPIFNSLLGELRKLGLEAMNLFEKPFDPALAEAVVHEAAVDGNSEGSEPIVSEVLRSGYTWNGRVLRPAMVKVKG
jgi:molecular chaperone GrpE